MDVKADDVRATAQYRLMLSNDDDNMENYTKVNVRQLKVPCKLSTKRIELDMKSSRWHSQTRVDELSTSEKLLNTCMFLSSGD